MAISDDERREVAARLRNLPSDAYNSVKELEKDGIFIDLNLEDEADYSQIHNAVFRCFPSEYMHPGDYEELHERLADLIDPTCHIVTTAEGKLWCDRCHTLLLGTRAKPNFCPNCGARVSEDGIASVAITDRATATERVCPNCGAHIVSTIERTYDGWTEYCPDCGEELVSE